MEFEGLRAWVARFRIVLTTLNVRTERSSGVGFGAVLFLSCRSGRCLALALGLMLQVIAAPQSVAETKAVRELEEKRFEVLHIPLVPWPRQEGGGYQPNFYGFWLNDTDLVMSVLQDTPDAFAKKLERIVLIDTTTGAFRVLVEQGHVTCRNRQLEVMAYLPYELSYYNDYPGRKIKPEDFAYAHLGEDGLIEPVLGPSPIERNCSPMGSPVGIPAAGKPLRQGDGHIDLSARDDKETATLGTAKLVRPGMPSVELGIPNAAVSWPIYLPYYDKYLMSAADYRRSSGTAKKHSGIYWKFPYRVSPYWLVSRSGEVEAIPFPEVIEQYGVSEFEYLWPTPQGLLINDTRAMAPGKGLLLLQGDRLYRVWGGPLPLVLNLFKNLRGRGEIVYVLNISPDGCRVVFTHASRYPLPKDKSPDPVPLSVLNLCKEQ